MEFFVAATANPVSNTVIESLDENQTFANKSATELAPAVGFIKRKIQAEQTRYEGLMYLKIFLQQCPYDVVSENAVFWINHSITASNSTNLPAAVLAFQVLQKLLRAISAAADLQKLKQNDVMNKVLVSILTEKHNLSTTYSALSCLETCLTCYNGPCGNRRPAIEKYLLKFVDCSNGKVTNQAARCLHLLQQINRPGEVGLNHKTAWEKQVHRLCDTMHSILNDLYASVTEFKVVTNELNPLDLPKDNDDITNGVTICHQKSLRFSNIVRFLENMLTTSYPVAKPVNAERILDIISRGLEVNYFSIKNQTLETVILKSIIPNIHQHLFDLLNALNKCLAGNMIPYSSLIANYALKTLLWTSTNENNNSYRCLKLSVYKMLNSWLTLSKSASLIEVYISELLPVIMKDVEPYKQEVILTVHKDGTKHLSKKARKKMQKAHIENSAIGKNYSSRGLNSHEITNFSSAEEICQIALITLQNIIQAIGPFVEVVWHKTLQEFVVRTIFESLRGFRVHLYSNHFCRLELYKLLLALISNCHPTLPPPVQYAVDIFSKAQFDRVNAIASFSIQALQIIEKIVHPASRSLNFPLDITQLADISDFTIPTQLSPQNTPLTNGEEFKEDNADNQMHTLAISDEENVQPQDDVVEIPNVIDITFSPEPIDYDAEALHVVDSQETFALSNSNSSSHSNLSEPLEVVTISKTDDLTEELKKDSDLPVVLEQVTIVNDSNGSVSCDITETPSLCLTNGRKSEKREFPNEAETEDVRLEIDDGSNCNSSQSLTKKLKMEEAIDVEEQEILNSFVDIVLPHIIS